MDTRKSQIQTRRVAKKVFYFFTWQTGKIGGPLTCELPVRGTLFFTYTACRLDFVGGGHYS